MVEGTVVVIDALDATLPVECSAYPATAIQRTVAHLLELFCGEGPLRPAMQYRWGFDHSNVTS